MKSNRPDPIMLPMNSEESQRYGGIRQALMNLPKNFMDPNRAANPYGVVYPDPPPMEATKEQAMDMPVPGGRVNGGIRPDGMLPMATGDEQPNPGAMAMPSPQMQQMMAMQQPGGMPQGGMPQQAPGDQRGLGLLMQRLQGRM